jgi:hypothetical protein
MDIPFAFRIAIEIGYNSFAKTWRRRHMTSEAIREGFDVFLHDGDKAVGAVRQVHAKSITIYVENAGDFVVPREAVRDVHDEKVVLDAARLERKLLDAIRTEHSREDPRIT